MNMKMKWLPLAIVGATIQAQASIISVNVNEANSRVPMASTDLAGAPGVRVGNWNNFLSGNKTLPADITSPSAGQLVYDDGAVVGSSFQVTTVGPGGYAPANELVNDQRMYSGFFDLRQDKPLTITMTDIPYAQYDLYVYAQGQNASGSNFRGGSVELTGGQIYYFQGAASPNDDGTGYVEMTTTSIPATPVKSDIAFGNFISYKGLSASSVTVTVRTYLWTDYDRAQTYGFQIVQVPEPASLGLVGLAGLGLLWRRRCARA